MPLEVTVIRHEFVDFIPEEMAENVLYVSIAYNTVAHHCFCGCGSKVVTPLSPTDWKMIYDGRSVSLRPSVGSWNLPCRSHYVIEANRVRWGDSWSPQQVAAERQRDRVAKARYYRGPKGDEKLVSAVVEPKDVGAPRRATLLTRLARLLGLS